jgi:hypothetical protein
MFGNIVTPQGVGPTQNGYGESRWLLEERLMQGVVSACWDHKDDVCQMDLIKRVDLKMASSSFIIGKTIFTCQIANLMPSTDVDTAEKVLNSLDHLHLTPPSAYVLAESQGGDFHARVTKTTALPKQEAVDKDVWFISYLGSDRWETPP